MRKAVTDLLSSIWRNREYASQLEIIDDETDDFLRPNFEDVMLRRALLGVENGFYVDVGAWDPNEHSVTRHFYDEG